MQQIDWRLTGVLVLAIVSGMVLIALAWQAAKLVFKLLLTLLILLLLGAGIWYFARSMA
jgi:hypothetical protein